jgi:hypothetical protein
MLRLIALSGFSIALACAVLGIAQPAAALAPAPAAIATAIATLPDAAPCVDQAHGDFASFVGKAFTITQLHLNSGADIVTAQGHDPCTCGNVNCEIVALQKHGNLYRVLMNDYAYSAHFKPDGTAQLDSHDSAAVVIRTSYRFDGTKYALARTEAVDVDTNTTKLDPMQVAFKSGTSSTIITSHTTALGYPDRFTIAATAGERLTLSFVHKDARVGTLSVEKPDATSLASTEKGTLTVKLPASGTYDVSVEGNDPDKLGSYALRIAITK